MSDTVQQIKERLDIVDFIRSYLPLSPAGKNFKARCPFHKEKTPSFVVSPDRQIWHCFGNCGAGGDIVGFLMRYENLEFIEALKVLAEKAGVDFRRSGSDDQKQYARLYDINQTAKEYFQSNLARSELVKNYLRDRGLKRETIEEFELGFASNEASDNLTRHLVRRGYNIADVERAGLIFKTERGTYCDRFRNRVMFPLNNHFGKNIGFTGRVMPGAENANIGKYVNSPETPIFNKSKVLFGLHKTKNAIRDLQSVVLVEGQMDFLMFWQSGVQNVAATSGTALTPEHLKSLKRITGSLIIAFDNDEAGQAATERTIDLASGYDFDVKVVVFNIEKDPAELAQKNPGAIKELIANARSAMEYYFAKYLENREQGTENREIRVFKNNIRTVLSKIKNIASPVERAHWVKEIANRTGIDEKPLFEEMAALTENREQRTVNGEQRTGDGGTETLSRRDLIAQRLLGMSLANQDLVPALKNFYNYFPPAYRDIFDSPSQSAPLADLIRLRSSLEFDNLEPAKVNSEFQELLAQLKMEHLKEKSQSLETVIKETERNGDSAALTQALQEFDKVLKEMQNL